MYWLVAGLFLIGTICGATIRLMAFIVVLLGAAGIAIAATVSHGLGGAVLDMVIAVVMLQIGYAAGFVLRAAWRSRRVSSPPRLERKPPVHAPLGEKRR
jgi:hypothetical protein